MDVAIAAGGTAGHINPALALAEELRERGHSLRFYGRPDKLEGRLVPEAGFELVPVEVTGFDRSRPWTAVSSLARVAAARRALARGFERAGAPGVAVGFGAYVELPLLGACRRRGIPYLLHEQNSVPGLANKMMAKGAARVCISVPAAREAFAGKTKALVLTGNPVRRSIVGASRAQGRAALGVGEDKTLLLVFGGSLGARTINEGVTALKERLLAVPGLEILHSTGKDGFEATRSALALTDDEARRWRLVPYISEMGEALAAADLVLSRAGASSVAEIAAVGTPAVLVPYPYATADHQTTNARFLTDVGAALLFADDEVAGEAFAERLLALLADGEARQAMRDAASGLGQAGAAARLADEVEAVACG